MSETWARLAWVLGAVVVATAAILILRYRIRERPVVIQQAILGSGVYLFTSATCPDCEAARRLLVEAIGPSSFVELSWESHPETFRDIGIGAVPATLIVREAGHSTIYRGRPDQALEALSP
jgi:glutaredoxin